MRSPKAELRNLAANYLKLFVKFKEMEDEIRKFVQANWRPIPYHRRAGYKGNTRTRRAIILDLIFSRMCLKESYQTYQLIFKVLKEFGVRQTNNHGIMYFIGMEPCSDLGKTALWIPDYKNPLVSRQKLVKVRQALKKAK